MEKLRIKLNTDQVNVLLFFLYNHVIALTDKRIIIDLNRLNDISHLYLLKEICNRLSGITTKGGRLSITPAEAVTILKVFNSNNNNINDIYVNNILQAVFNAVHKYLSNLL
jgi:hypothetical protein